MNPFGWLIWKIRQWLFTRACRMRYGPNDEGLNWREQHLIDRYHDRA